MALQSIKDELLYKRFSKKEYTSLDKNWHEEQPGRTITIKYQDVWTDELPAFPPTTSTNIIQKIDNLYLTKDVTVPDNKTWLVCETTDNLTTRIGDFIQPDKDLSQAYFIRLFDSVGKQIFVGDPSDWDFDYANGILTFENSPTLFISPFKISGYRYVGIKGRNLKHEVTTLDEGYHGPLNDGMGRFISADKGPVAITPSNGYAPLQLDSLSLAPTLGIKDGQIFTKDGQIFIRDGSRGKWLAMNRQNITFGTKRADGCYLNLSNFSSHMAGWPSLRDGTILGITAQASAGFSEKHFIISKGSSTIFEFDLTNYYYANGNLNVDFTGGDLIKILASSRYPTTFNVIITLEISWRCVS